MDYGKHLFERRSRLRLQEESAPATNQRNQVSSRDGRRGLPGKATQPGTFHEDGDKAKVSLRFRGREMAHQELGMELLKRVEADLIEIGTVEQHPKLEGRQLMMVIAPKKRK